MAEHIRQVIREVRFERELRALINEAIEADRFVEAAEFLIARDPLVGSCIDRDSGVYFIPMAPVAGHQVSLYYNFDESTVWLLSIKRG
jgi:hypothetical protein